jgi:hypothetical protein
MSLAPHFFPTVFSNIFSHSSKLIHLAVILSHSYVSGIKLDDEDSVKPDPHGYCPPELIRTR